MLLVASFFCLPYYTETISNDRGYQGDLWIDPLTRLKPMRMSSLGKPIVTLVLEKQTLFFIRLSNDLIIANCEMQTHHHRHYHHNLKQVTHLSAFISVTFQRNLRPRT